MQKTLKAAFEIKNLIASSHPPSFIHKFTHVLHKSAGIKAVVDLPAALI
jgi:hypothetical protein